MPPLIVVAPDSFKATLGAAGVAAAIAEGWQRVRPGDTVLAIPQADGGEGTLDAVEAAVDGAVRRVAAQVCGPDGRPVDAEWIMLPDATAVVELASSSGLPLMRQLHPMGATSRGLGEVIGAALDAGARRLLIGLGGSASTDGGRAALEAIGWPGALRRLPPGGITLLTDVTAPLLGPTGAAAVFAPQKGATAQQVRQLEARLADFAAELGGDPSAPGAGAAGGCAYGLATVLGADITSGADAIARLTGLDAAITRADAVITGEGRFDQQSMMGKVVGRVLAKAPDRTIVIAGSFAVLPREGVSLSDLTGVDAAMAEPERWIREAAALAAQRFAASTRRSS